MRERVILALAVLVTAALAAAMAAAQTAPLKLPDIPNPKVAVEAPEIGKFGGTYIVSSISDPRTFNPVVAQETSSTSVTGAIFEGLVEQNYLTGEIEPALAESWTTSPDGRTWTFTLRQGIRWSDGAPLTIDDVVFSLEAVFTDGVQTSTVDLLTIEDKPIRWRKVDDRRIAFITDKPVGTFLRLIGSLDIIPKHKLGEALARGGAEFNKTYGVVSPPKLTWFQDARFRRALNYAIDRKTIADQVYAGRASPAWGPESTGNTLYYNPRLPQYPYDPGRAQQMLAEAGYQKGGDGLLHDSQGNVVEFTISTNAGNTDREAIGNIVRQDFTKLGIRVTFAPEAFNTLVGKLTDTFKWEAVIIGLTGGIEPVTGRNVWLSSGSLHMWWPKQDKAVTEW